MKIRPLFAWYDLWVGIYWDKNGRRLYILPVPCLGVVLQFDTTVYCKKCGKIDHGGPDDRDSSKLCWCRDD